MKVRISSEAELDLAIGFTKIKLRDLATNLESN